MHLRRGELLWPNLPPRLESEPIHCAPLAEDIRCDTLVVGSGITGALIADSLVDAGRDVVVIDKRQIMGGSTPASTALLQYEIDTPLLDLIGLHGRRSASSAYLASLQAIKDFRTLIDRTGVKCDAVARSSLFLARPESDVGYLLREWVARREIGIGAAFLWHDELATRFQVDRPAAILSPVALEIDPWQFTKQLWMRSLQRGVRMYGRTAIAAEHWSHFPSSVRTANGFHVTCENVVLATGYEAPEQFPKLRSLCSLKSTFALATEPMDEARLWPGRALIWEMGDPYLYMRTTADNRVLIGGEDIPFTGALPDDASIDAATQSLMAKLGALFPQLSDVSAEFAWTGVFASTPDGLPYIGTPKGTEHCHFALGYGGNGITFSLIAAQIICDQICGRPESPHAKLFAFSRERG